MKVVIAILSSIVAVAVFSAAIAQSTTTDVAATISLAVSEPNITANVPLTFELTTGEVISMTVTINLSEDKTVQDFEIQDAQVLVLPLPTDTPTPIPTSTTVPTVEPTQTTAPEDEEESEHEIVTDLTKVLDERDGTFATVYFYRSTGWSDGGMAPMLFRMNREKMAVVPDKTFSRCYIKPGKYTIGMESNTTAFTGFLNPNVEISMDLEPDDIVFIKGDFETDQGITSTDTFSIANRFWKDAVNEIANQNLEYHPSDRCVTRR